MSNVTAVIPAAGQGSRMKSSINKQFLNLLDRPVLAHTLAVFESNDKIDSIIVVVKEEEMQICRSKVIAAYPFTKVKAVIPGGRERWESVAKGLEQCNVDTGMVVVHDGARPLLTCSLLDHVLEAAAIYGAAIAAVPVKDCIKEVERDTVATTLNRNRLWAVQTPQAFRYELLKKVYAAPIPEVVYDDAMLVEQYGHPVKVVNGDYANIKITTPEDLRVAATLMEGRK